MTRALTARQRIVYDLLPEKGSGYVREDVLITRLQGLTATEARCTLEQLQAKKAARGFTSGMGPVEWRRGTEAERGVA